MTVYDDNDNDNDDDNGDDDDDYYFVIIIILFEGSLEVKLPTIWRDEKQSREEA